MSNKKSLAAVVGTAAAAALMIFLPAKEGVRFEPYYDVVGVKTVCMGSTENVEDRTYTAEECGEILEREAAHHAEGAMKCLTQPTTDGQRVAYVSLAFNIGVNAFCRSTLVRLHNAGDYAGACAQLLKWDKGVIGGKLVAIAGLTKRRADEKEYCDGRKKI